MAVPLIIAHRALTPGATGNTLSAIRLAAACGADLIELDVRLSLDRRPVLFHDAFLGRSTRGRGWVRLWPSFALGRLPLRDAAEGDRITSLRQVLAGFPETAQAAFHLKDRAALPAVLRTLARHGRPERTWLWLEHPHDARTARRALPALRVTLLRPAGWTPANREQYFAEAQWFGAAAVSVPWGVIDAGLIDHAHRHHLLVFSRQERLHDIPHHARLGLDGIISDDPAAARAAMDQRP